MNNYILKSKNGKRLYLYCGKYEDTKASSDYYGLYDNNGECFVDITINIPSQQIKNNEIILSNDIDIDLLDKLLTVGIFKDVHKFAYSGFSSYMIVELCKDKIDKYVNYFEEGE